MHHATADDGRRPLEWWFRGGPAGCECGACEQCDDRRQPLVSRGVEANTYDFRRH